MQNITLKQFIESSSIPASLIRSTVRQCGGWKEFKEIAGDVSRHGADCGFGQFCYYSDTVPFAKRNKSAIMELCKDQAEDFYGRGTTIPQFIAYFNCLKGIDLESVAIALYAGKGEDCTQVYNALAWYALEEVSRQYCDIVEE